MSHDQYTEYLLQIHLYMGKDFPPADETGAADPFIIARCQGQRAKTDTKFETLNPGFFETVQMVVSLPPLDDERKKSFPTPGISLLVYDQDTGLFAAKKDLLGRVWINVEQKISQITSPVDGKSYTVMAHKEAQWYNLIFDATGAEDGKLLVGYDIIPLDLKSLFPLEQINIKPKMVDASLSMAIIGLRDVVPSIDLFPVNKIFCKFDISGDAKHPVKTNKHAVIAGSCNVFEIVTIDVDVPIDIQYAPTLTVYVYDTVFGIVGERLVGVANISLKPYCQRVLD